MEQSRNNRRNSSNLLDLIRTKATDRNRQVMLLEVHELLLDSQPTCRSRGIAFLHMHEKIILMFVHVVSSRSFIDKSFGILNNLSTLPRAKIPRRKSKKSLEN